MSVPRTLAAFSIALLLSGAALADPILNGRLIVIDAGHGTINLEGRVINTGKATRNGTAEHRLTMAISQKVGKRLQEEGAQVVFTRTPQDYWRMAYDAAEDNKSRALLANDLKSEALISIHCDWSPKPRVSGVTTLYEFDSSRHLAQSIHQEMVRQLRSGDRHVVHDNFTILDHAQVPAVIVETGFMSNRNESKKLATKAYQEKVAKAVVDGLRKYFAEK